MVQESQLQEMTRRLVQGFSPERIILFGSQARGTATEQSDVDILVVCPLKVRRHDLTVAMYQALRGLGVARDIVVRTPEEFEGDRNIPGTVSRPAWREGRVLYERG